MSLAAKEMCLKCIFFVQLWQQNRKLYSVSRENYENVTLLNTTATTTAYLDLVHRQKKYNFKAFKIIIGWMWLLKQNIFAARKFQRRLFCC